MANYRYSIEEVFYFIGSESLNQIDNENKKKISIEIDGFFIYPNSLRYMTFYQKGTICSCCGKKGEYFLLDGDENTNRRHFNLYAKDGTLMTKDHIIPKSKGGLDIVSNMQTMCVDCNVRKGNVHSEIKVEYIVGTHVDTGKEIKFRSMEKAACHCATQLSKATIKNNSKDTVVKVSVSTTIKLLMAIENKQPYHKYIWTKELR